MRNRTISILLCVLMATLFICAPVVSSANDGWQMINGKWYYFYCGQMLKSCFVEPQTKDGVWYCLNDKGELASNEWVEMLGGYVRNGVHYPLWSYARADGSVPRGWNLIDGKWYYFQDESFVKECGWADETYDDFWSSVRPYVLQGGNFTLKGVKYGFDHGGAMITGWYLNDDGFWSYYGGDGVLRTNWVLIDGSWYLFDLDGNMLTGWVQSDNCWYYLDKSGAMLTDWQKIGDVWYYLGKNGAMANGWQEINGQWEFFSEDGAWQYTWDGK